MIKKDNIRVTITISKNLHSKLLEEAEYEDRSVSNLIARILKRHYKIKTDG